MPLPSSIRTLSTSTSTVRVSFAYPEALGYDSDPSTLNVRCVDDGYGPWLEIVRVYAEGGEFVTARFYGEHALNDTFCELAAKLNLTN
jgi:hypothetical protein